MIQEQAVAAVIAALIFEKNKSRQKRKEKKSPCVKPWLKRRIEFYETLLAELRLEDEFMFISIILSTQL